MTLHHKFYRPTERKCGCLPRRVPKRSSLITISVEIWYSWKYDAVFYQMISELLSFHTLWKLLDSLIHERI